MNFVFDIDDTIYDLMQPFEKTHKKLYADKTDMDCRTLFMKSRLYSDKILAEEKRGLIPHEESFCLRIIQTYHDAGIEINHEEAKKFEKIYRDCQKHIQVDDTIREILDTCRRKNVFMAILSNGNLEAQYNKVLNLQLHRWFNDDHIFISDAIGYQKPDTRAFYYIEEKNSLNPSETWYIGDTYETDIVGAYNSGWKTIWFNHRNRSCPDSINHADIEVKNSLELKKILFSFV